MKIIVGLGNPGEKYQNTRHNIGFMVVDRFFKNIAHAFQTNWETNSKLKNDMVRFEWKPKKGELTQLILAKPKTYMNNSGMAVKLLVDFYKASLQDIWVVHDDMDLLLGGIRIRMGGAPGGHHGIESIIETLGTADFVRFRIGIGRPFKKEDPRHSGRRDREKVDEFVLSQYDEHEEHLYKDTIKKAVKAIEEALEHGLERAMNRFNAK